MTYLSKRNEKQSKCKRVPGGGREGIAVTTPVGCGGLQLVGEVTFFFFLSAMSGQKCFSFHLLFPRVTAALRN